jgi:hypothetical protein
MGTMIFETISKRSDDDDTFSEARKVDDDTFSEARKVDDDQAAGVAATFPGGGGAEPAGALEAAVDRIIVQACPETASPAAPGKFAAVGPGPPHLHLRVRWDDPKRRRARLMV